MRSPHGGKPGARAQLVLWPESLCPQTIPMLTPPRCDGRGGGSGSGAGQQGGPSGGGVLGNGVQRAPSPLLPWRTQSVTQKEASPEHAGTLQNGASVLVGVWGRERDTPHPECPPHTGFTKTAARAVGMREDPGTHVKGGGSPRLPGVGGAAGPTQGSPSSARLHEVSKKALTSTAPRDSPSPPFPGRVLSQQDTLPGSAVGSRG